METTINAETTGDQAALIGRLGYRELERPRTYHCVRNGEPLMLTVHLYENRNACKVLYYTEAVYIPGNKPRHTTLFHFNADSDHEALHKYCLHALFFDEKIGAHFEQEHNHTAPAHLDAEKAEQFRNWVRLFWNSNYFKEKYKELGGLEHASDLIRKGVFSKPF
ncbi:hypothetical protein [Taibaiella koreensis]|uniref:hypothetical protein n=1 Tax=Taibaiella koreensis TaxID=1268548 RepID=UPI000E5A07C0|nr:hypothetical protein [Taibaiella koreensis]